jgi:hypothetical protein
VKRKLVGLAAGIILIITFIAGATASPANPGCVGQSVSLTAPGGGRAAIVHNWHQDSASAGVPNGVWGVNWMRAHCHLPGGN